MFSTQYELAYISEELPADRESLYDACINKDRYFRMPAIVSNGKADIGNGIALEPKTTYMSYLNVNWLIRDVLKIDGLDDDKLRGDNAYGWTASVEGADNRLFVERNEENVPTYFLQLSTDLLDDSERLASYMHPHDEGMTFYIKSNPLSISYVSWYTPMGKPTNIRFNVREATTSNSTAYSLYDGGELQWDD